MNGLSLCSGAGGLDLAIQALGVETKGYVEIDQYAQAILCTHMRDGRLDSAPIWPDIKTLDASTVLAQCGSIDLIYGGIPCQPHSTAGRRRGEEDERDLWPATVALIRALRPRAFLLENVAGFSLQRSGEPAFAWSVITDLTEAGYDCRWTHVRASDAGAPHRRERFFLLALADSGREQQHVQQWVHGTKSPRSGYELDQPEHDRRMDGQSSIEPAEAWQQAFGHAGTRESDMEHPNQPGLEGRDDRPERGPYQWSAFPPGPKGDWTGIPEQLWPSLEPSVRGVVDGLADGVDEHRKRRLEALGNGVVPHQALIAIWQLVNMI